MPLEIHEFDTNVAFSGVHRSLVLLLFTSKVLFTKLWFVHHVQGVPTCLEFFSNIKIEEPIIEMKVAILGTGNIGMDLLIKLIKLKEFEVVGFIGRRPCTKNLPDGVDYHETGIHFFIQNPKCCSVVFDCTDAYSATEHAKIFLEQDIFVIDMTPSKVGRMCVPHLNPGVSLKNVKNVNMITCGGQVSLPIIHYIAARCTVSYVEVVTQISSESAGTATRINIDKYIETTENAIMTFTHVPKCKVILNVNPCSKIYMQTTLFFKTSGGDFSDFETVCVKRVQSYVPHYEVLSGPTLTEGVVSLTVRVRGSGDYLSVHAGNLDIINCAALEIAKQWAHVDRSMASGYKVFKACAATSMRSS